MFKGLSLLVLVFYYLPAYTLDIFRDSEVEIVVKDLGKPLFDAAGIDSKDIKIFIINNDDINAFILDNIKIFLHLGLLQYSTEPYALLGVLAHELAHISAGHVLQRIDATNDITSVIVGSSLLGLVSGMVVDPKIAGAIMLGSITVGINSLNTYSQEQEKMADSYALKYLDESGYSNKGIKDVLHYLKSQEHTRQYISTHPCSDQRLISVYNYKVKRKLKEVPNEKLLRFKRMVMMLDSFFMPIDILQNKYSGNDKTYLDPIILYRKGQIGDFIIKIDSLVEEIPQLYKLKAEMLSKAGRLSEAIESYERYLQYLPDESGLIRLQLSHILLCYGDIKKAIVYLEKIVSIEPKNTLIWQYLSIAYKYDFNLGMSYFSSAKKAFIEKDYKNFIKYANLAVGALPEDSIHLLHIADMKKSKKHYFFST